MVDTASGLKEEQVKDLPTNARYAVYHENPAKENVRDLTSSISQTKVTEPVDARTAGTMAKNYCEASLWNGTVKQKNSLLLRSWKHRLQDKNNIMMNRPRPIFRLHMRNLNKPNKSVQQLSPIFKSKVNRQGTLFKKNRSKPATSTTTADRMANVQSQKNVRLLFKEYHYKIQEADHQSKPPPLRKSVRNHEVETLVLVVLDYSWWSSHCFCLLPFYFQMNRTAEFGHSLWRCECFAEVLGSCFHGRKYASMALKNVNILAIIQVESGGTAEDVMQSSEPLIFHPIHWVQKNLLSKVWSISVNY